MVVVRRTRAYMAQERAILIGFVHALVCCPDHKSIERPKERGGNAQCWRGLGTGTQNVDVVQVELSNQVRPVSEEIVATDIV